MVVELYLLVNPGIDRFRNIALAAEIEHTVQGVVRGIGTVDTPHVTAQLLIFVACRIGAGEDPGAVYRGMQTLRPVRPQAVEEILAAGGIPLNEVELQVERVVEPVRRHAIFIAAERRVELVHLQGRCHVLRVTHHDHRDVAYQHAPFDGVVPVCGQLHQA